MDHGFRQANSRGIFVQVNCLYVKKPVSEQSVLSGYGLFEKGVGNYKLQPFRKALTGNEKISIYGTLNSYSDSRQCGAEKGSGRALSERASLSFWMSRCPCRKKPDVHTSML